MAKDLAIQSEGCAEFNVGGKPLSGWDNARKKCRKSGYEAVHAYIGTTDANSNFLSPFVTNGFVDIGDIPSLIEDFVARDPWTDGLLTKQNVVRIVAKTPEGILRQIGALLKQCKVIDYAFLAGHGLAGALYFGDKNAYSTSQVLLHAISPCALAPGAKIQTLACLQGCPSAIEPLRQGLQKIYTNPIYRPSPDRNPFEGAQFLFNTANGIAYPPLASWVFVNRAHTHSENELGIVFKTQKDSVGTDLPKASVPACADEIEKSLKYNFSRDPQLSNPYLPLTPVSK